MKIAMGNDHTAIELKNIIKEFVESKGYGVVGSELAKMITEAWLDAKFEGGRHERRVQMLMDIENR